MKNNLWCQKFKMLLTDMTQKILYCFLGWVFSPNTSPILPLKSLKAKTTIKDFEDIMSWWTEHFTNLCLNSSTVDDTVIDNLPQNEFLNQMSILPTHQEVKLAIKQINIGKAPGLDGIPVELLHFDGETVLLQVFNLFTLIWEGTRVSGLDWWTLGFNL